MQHWEGGKIESDLPPKLRGPTCGTRHEPRPDCKNMRLHAPTHLTTSSPIAISNRAPGTVRAFGVYYPLFRKGGGRRDIGMTGSVRTSAGLDERRRRLLYRAWHRGTRGMDLIMGRFPAPAVGEFTQPKIPQLHPLPARPPLPLFAS